MDIWIKQEKAESARKASRHQAIQRHLIRAQSHAHRAERSFDERMSRAATLAQMHAQVALALAQAPNDMLLMPTDMAWDVFVEPLRAAGGASTFTPNELCEVLDARVHTFREKGPNMARFGFYLGEDVTGVDVYAWFRARGWIEFVEPQVLRVRFERIQPMRGPFGQKHFGSTTEGEPA